MTFNKQKYWEEKKKAQEPKKKQPAQITQLDIAYMLRYKKNHRHTKGAFGRTRDIGYYKSLKVVPRSKRTEENSTESGIQKV